MPPKPPDLATLQAQARRHYYFWHVFLVQRIREKERHLTVDERAHLPHIGGQTPPFLSPELALLREQGLWKGDMSSVASMVWSPISTVPTNSLRFEVDVQSDGVSLYAVSGSYQTELMRVRHTDQATLDVAAETFNRLVHTHECTLVYAAAQRWCELHGSRVLGWVATPTTALPANVIPLAPTGTEGASSALPARKRGRGSFRMPS